MLPRYRFFLLDVLYGIVAQIEKHTILMISADNLTKAAKAMGDMISRASGLISWIGHSRRYMGTEGVIFYFRR